MPFSYQIWCHHGQKVGEAVEVSEAAANTLVIIFRWGDRRAGHRGCSSGTQNTTVIRWIFGLHTTKIGWTIHVKPERYGFIKVTVLKTSGSQTLVTNCLVFIRLE